MAEPPTILRVSIGAYHCSLEGFADPVETLVEVTEYVRGLVASDPRFAGGLRLPEAEDLRRLVAEAGEGVVEVRIDMSLDTATSAQGAAAHRPGDPAPVAGAGPRPDGATDEFAAVMRAAALAQQAVETAEPTAPAEAGPTATERTAEEVAAALMAQVAAEASSAVTEPVVAGVVAGADGPSADRPHEGAAGALPSTDAARREAGTGTAAPHSPVGLWGEEDGLEEAQARPQLRPAGDAGGADLAQLAQAFAQRRSPSPSEPVAPAAVAEPEPVPAPPSEVVPNPSRQSLSLGAYDWGLDEDEWFVQGAVVEPGTVQLAPDPSSPGRRWILGQSPDQDEASLLRILSRAESKLSEPDAMRRREAMAHLKAAVAATEAERALGEEEPEADRGANPAAATVEAAERNGAAPLRLVASQRVDLPRMRAALRGGGPRPRPVEEGADLAPLRAPAAEPVPASALEPVAGAEPVAPPPAPTVVVEAPVEPSLPAALVEAAAQAPEPPPPEPRVAAPEVAAMAAPAAPPTARPEPAEAAPTEPPDPWTQDASATPAPLPPAEAAGGGFAAFARARGAAALADLLEAAAAWATLQGGATRPELAALVAEAQGDEPDRDEMLRLVGILLREGRIEKLGGGRFRAVAGGRFDPAT